MITKRAHIERSKGFLVSLNLVLVLKNKLEQESFFKIEKWIKKCPR